MADQEITTPHKDLTIIVIAPGPGLTKADADMATAWRDSHRDTRKIIAVNLACRLAPTADIVHAADQMFWDQYGVEVCQGCKDAKRSTRSPSSAPKWQAELHEDLVYSNSGTQAIALAHKMGATKIILLGFNFAEVGGRKHFHQDHPAPMYNAPTFSQEELLKLCVRITAEDKIPTINCSIETVIDFLPWASLYDTLWKPAEYRGSVKSA